MTRFHNESVWNTVVTIQIEDEISDDVWDSLLRESIAFLHGVNKVFSPFLFDSYLSLTRSGEISADQLVEASRSDFRYYQPYFDSGFTQAAVDAFEVIESACVAAQWKTDGAFNAWRGGSFYDPIGLVKGWAADQTLEILRHFDIKRAFINAGGDIACLTPDEPWRIAVGDPRDPMKAIGFLEYSNGAVCTSGTAEKGQHIDKHREQIDFSSVTITGPSATMGDAFATAAMSDGLACFEWFEKLGDEWGIITINEDCTDIYSRNWVFEDFEFKPQLGS